jgi:hypothetical protein
MTPDSRFSEAYVQECIEREFEFLERIATALENLNKRLDAGVKWSDDALDEFRKEKA